MTDIVERLRDTDDLDRSDDLAPLCHKAADAIERLRAALQEIAHVPATLEAKIDLARRALEPKP